MRPFQKIQVSDWGLSKVQDNVDQALRPVLSAQVIDGHLIENISLSSGQDNLIGHGLGRALKMWVLARKNASVQVWEETSPAPDSTLNLHASVACVVSLWVA